MVLAKYTYEFGGHSSAGLPTKAAKADVPGDRLTFFAGYTNVNQANPSTPVGFGNAAGGYPLTVAVGLPDNNAFTTAKILQFFWAGAKYDFAWGLSLTGAFYHVDQNSFVADSARHASQAAPAKPTAPVTSTRCRS
ncbi:MAG TPA: hypothetical protein VKS24_12405 [Bradyrhizobium sp.]|nr:hypothetical protein [Bradyrhizobium sp.]